MRPLPQKIGSHYRAPWRPSDPRHILVHCTLGELKGSYRRSEKEARPYLQRYERAKRHYCTRSAADIVAGCVKSEIIDLVIDALLEANKPALVVCPHPEFDEDGECDLTAPTPPNALPFAFANLIARELGCEVATNIIEVARPSRTKLNAFPRFLWQPRFEGDVRTDRAYILVDDVCTLGGTWSAPRLTGQAAGWV